LYTLEIHLMNGKIRALALIGIFCGSAAAVQGVPFASQISVTSKNVVAGVGTTISYHLNEAADSVTIELVDSNGNVVSTFSGPAVQGPNNIAWDGTVDNAGGAGVAAGQFRVRISASKNSSAWSEIASNRSKADKAPKSSTYSQLFSGFTVNDCIFVSDPESEFFGQGVASISGATPRVAAAVAINSDTSTADGTDGFTSRIFKTTMEATANQNSCWGMAQDVDDPKVMFIASQHSGATNKLWRGDLSSSATAVTADPQGYLSGNALRTIVIARYGGTKYVFFCQINDIYKAELDPETNNVKGAATKITAFSNPNYYARGLDVDAAGNLYFVSKHQSNGTGGALFRWNASLVSSGVQLTEINSSWMITYPTSMINMTGPAITPNGNVYVAMLAGTATNRTTGIFHVGTTETASLVRQLQVEDRVVDFTQIGTPAVRWEASTSYCTLRSDPVGNLVAVDRDTEQIRVFGPPGESSTSVTAPESQAIAVTTGIDQWSLY
jgi:hypothetical protein